jgi:hypothetical protein
MKRILTTLAAAALITASAAAPAFADGGGRHSHGANVADALLWPITAALTLPAAIIGTVAQSTLPHQVVYENSAFDEGPAAYAGPRAYYAPRDCVERREHYQPRGDHGWGDRHEPGGHYNYRAHGGHGGRW